MTDDLKARLRELSEGDGPEGHGPTEAAAITELQDCFPDEDES